MTIEKKTWPDFFEKILSGQKTYDVRVSDFKCNPGDVLVLKEWDPKTKQYTGREIAKKVGFVGQLKDFSFWKQEDLEKYGLQVISLLED